MRNQMKKLLKPRDCLLCIALGYAIPSLPFWDMGTAAEVFMGIVAAGMTGFALIALNEQDRQKKRRQSGNPDGAHSKIFSS